jgi:hypothetical protein
MTRATSLVVNREDYFKNTGSKYLHFFMPYSNQLNLLNIDNADQGITSWKTVRLNKGSTSSFYKSIITPNGRIYLIGGSDKGVKFNTIYRYD